MTPDARPKDTPRSGAGGTKPGGQPGQRPTPKTNAPPNKPGQYDRDDADKAQIDEEHEGGTEEQVGDRTGPGAGYDDEPEQERDPGGVADS